jgi:flagellar biosynthesis protein FlhG
VKSARAPVSTKPRPSHALEDLDAEIDRLPPDTLAALEPAAPVEAQPSTSAPNPADDQATRLRVILGIAPAAPSPQPHPQPHAQPAPRHAPVRTPAIIPPAASRPDHTAKIIAVASGKGGVGKTSLSVNLAIALASRGLRVTLLDADLGTANADVLCGIMPHTRLDHLFSPAGGLYADGGRRSIRDLAVKAPGNFRLVPGSAGLARMADLEPDDQAALVESLAELERDADIIIVDTAAGIGRDVTGFLDAADLSIVVASPEPTSVADAYALIKCVVMNRTEQWGSVGAAVSPLALVVNQAATPEEAAAVHAKLKAVCARFLGLDLPSLGYVAQDLRVSEAVRAKVPLLLRTPQTPASHNIRDLSAAVLQQLAVREPQPAHTDHPPRPRGLSGALARLLRVPIR